MIFIYSDTQKDTCYKTVRFIYFLKPSWVYFSFQREFIVKNPFDLS